MAEEDHKERSKKWIEEESSDVTNVFPTPPSLRGSLCLC